MKTKYAKLDKLIDGEIRKLVGELQELEPGSEEYGRKVDNIEILTRSRKEIKEGDQYVSVKAEKIISSGLGLLGILLILNYEKTDVITSKAFTIATRMLGV